MLVKDQNASQVVFFFLLAFRYYSKVFFQVYQVGMYSLSCFVLYRKTSIAMVALRFQSVFEPIVLN